MQTQYLMKDTLRSRRRQSAIPYIALLTFLLAFLLATEFLLGKDLLGEEGTPTAATVDFVREIQPLLSTHCVACHGEKVSKSGLRLDVKQAALAGGDSGKILVSQRSDQSPLFERITSEGADRMPPEGDPLSREQIELLKRWIDQGAVWPDGVDKTTVADKYDWWSLKRLVRPEIPVVGPQHPQNRPVEGTATSNPLSPIDAFILAKLQEKGLSPSPAANRQTLIRRVYFDLIGLPPRPDEVEAFLADPAENAYEQLVDKLLDSPHYGERWARHWLDIVHYGDTHGYDKDKPRPNAWPYRDYVIQALNRDKPYAQFVAEQIAGDVIAPDSAEGITATGFIAAGPWDFIGHAEVPESKTDGLIARLLDRDDMVSNTCNTFLSLTVQCARCHNHKFDPVIQDDYYRLQAVFAALDRADHAYDSDPKTALQRTELLGRQTAAKESLRQLEAKIAEMGGEPLKQLDQKIAAAGKPDPHPLSVQFGYHSEIAAASNTVKWVQVDLGESRPLTQIQLVGCHDDFNGIGAGFGFPVRFRIEVSNHENFDQAVTTITDQTQTDFANPGIKVLKFAVERKSGRFLRITATKLAPRQNDFILALGELSVFDESGKNLAAGKIVRGLDSIEAPPRWRASNLVDGYFYGMARQSENSLGELQSQRAELVTSLTDAKMRETMANHVKTLTEAAAALAELPPTRMVYAGMVHTGSGAFTGTGHSGGKPRVIQVLGRGDVRNPLRVVSPGTVPLSPHEVGEFTLAEDHTEGQRRLALAKWITAKENPLTWRSIVNRVWMYHFGRGIVDSPNDFGRMGQLPTHPELLDWLAVEFRDGGQSLKNLHRLIVKSSTYRQSSKTDGSTEGAIDDATNNTTAQAIDASNLYLWRMNRRKLEAEAIRDSALMVAGKLNPQLGGPAFQDFIVEKPEHSPHYEYQLHDPEDVRIHRRSIYRFLVRSQPQPFMTTLDCADPSMSVDKRSETLTALQALTMLNNRLMLTMEKFMAQRVASHSEQLAEQVDFAFQLALSRRPTPEELAELTPYAKNYGLPGLCRILMNLNEFVFVD